MNAPAKTRRRHAGTAVADSLETPEQIIHTPKRYATQQQHLASISPGRFIYTSGLGGVWGCGGVRIPGGKGRACNSEPQDFTPKHQGACYAAAHIHVHVTGYPAQGELVRLVCTPQ